MRHRASAARDTQKVVVVLAALAIVADGFDGQLIGFAIPLII